MYLVLDVFRKCLFVSHAGNRKKPDYICFLVKFCFIQN